MRTRVEVDGGRDLDLSVLPVVFMRWKEKCFVNVGSDCGLTIAGFYYVCYDRRTGVLDGYYYDPNSTPFQRLALMPSTEGRAGYSFAGFSLT